MQIPCQNEKVAAYCAKPLFYIVPFGQLCSAMSTGSHSMTRVTDAGLVAIPNFRQAEMSRREICTEHNDSSNNVRNAYILPVGLTQKQQTPPRRGFWVITEAGTAPRAENATAIFAN